MRQIQSYEELAPLLSAQLRRGVMTNAALTPEDWKREIAAEALFCQSWESGLILLRRREGYALLSFYLQEPALPGNLTWDGPTLLEIAARPRDTALMNTAQLWRAQDFEDICRRERLVLPKDTMINAGGFPLMARTAGPADAEAVWALLRESFDPITGCLPTTDGLARDLKAGNVVCVDGSDREAAGLLHITTGRGATQLRHLAVGEAYRRQGVAQNLLACYLKHTGFAKSLVWVRMDNNPARRFYAKNGYAPDGWTSAVLYRP